MTTKLTTAQLEALVKKHLGIETIESRGRDALDFHDVHIDNLVRALRAAFAHGYEAGDADAELDENIADDVVRAGERDDEVAELKQRVEEAEAELDEVLDPDDPAYPGPID